MSLVLPSLDSTKCRHGTNHRYDSRLICRVCGRYAPDVQRDKYEIQKERMAARRNAPRVERGEPVFTARIISAEAWNGTDGPRIGVIAESVGNGKTHDFSLPAGPGTLLGARDDLKGRLLVIQIK